MNRFEWDDFISISFMICFSPYLDQNIRLKILYYHKRTWTISVPTFVSIHLLGHFKTMYTLASKKPNLFKLDINFC